MEEVGTETSANSGGATTITVSAPPTGTAQNDIMFAVVMLSNNDAISTVPTDWTVVSDGVKSASAWVSYSSIKVVVYWKLAGASEAGPYTWGTWTSSRCAAVIVTFRGDFDTADPIDKVSNTEYGEDHADTILRAAAVTVTNPGSQLVFFGHVHSSSYPTFTAPDDYGAWTEDVDYQGSSSTSRKNCSICHYEWSGSGATTDIDGTISASFDSKHAFLVALNPAAGGGGRTTKNARGNPLGVSHGMNFRGQL